MVPKIGNVHDRATWMRDDAEREDLAMFAAFQASIWYASRVDSMRARAFMGLTPEEVATIDAKGKA